MYILIEPSEMPDELQPLAHLAVSVAQQATGLPVGANGEIDGPVDESCDRRTVRIAEDLLDLIYDGDRVPAELAAFLRAACDHLLP